MRLFTIVDAEQRSPEWFAARVGRLTGSNAADMLATIKTGEAAARRDLRTRLVVERLTNQPQDDGYINAAMQWGIDHEAEAVNAYEALTGELVRFTGFLAHNDLMAGCSLDGHLGDFDGIVELKCPKSATHVRYLRGGILPSDYLPQVTHNLWITGASFCDFVSFDPRLPEHLQLFRVRVPRDEKAIAAYQLAVDLFLKSVDEEVAELRERTGAAA